MTKMHQITLKTVDDLAWYGLDAGLLSDRNGKKQTH